MRQRKESPFPVPNSRGILREARRVNALPETMSNPSTPLLSSASQGPWLSHAPSWRLVTANGLTAVALVAAWQNKASGLVLATLLVMQLVLVCWLVGSHHRLRLVGPLFAYELARLSRRGRTALLRCAYGVLLLAWLCFLLRGVPFSEIFGPGPAQPIQAWARFAQHFVTGVLALQGAAVLVLTPAYLASALAEEKERKTLELLFTTSLRDREIVLGKLFGRLTHLACILLTGLPILCLAQFWGGIDGPMLLAGFAVSALSLLSVGSLSMLCSVVAPNVLMAVVSSYGLVFVLSIFCVAFPAYSPLLFLNEFDRRFTAEWTEWQNLVSSGLPPGSLIGMAPPDRLLLLLEMLGECAVLHGLVFFLSTPLAIGLLRGAPVEPERAPPPVLRRGLAAAGSWGPYDEPQGTGLGLVKPVLPENGSWGPFDQPGSSRLQVVEPILPANGSWGPFEESESSRTHAPWPRRLPSSAVRDPALLWKEVYHGTGAASGPTLWPWPVRNGDWAVLLVLLPAGFFLYLLSVLSEVMSGAVNPVIRVLSVGLAGLWCLGVAFRTAGSICREREQRTLESLLLLPVEREEILQAKWLGSLLRWRQLGYVLAALWLVGLVTGALHPWAVLLLVGSSVAYLAFLASLGLWLSLASRTTLWANLSMALVLLLLFTSSWLGITSDWASSYPSGESDWLRSLSEVGFNPIHTWWFVGFSWKELIDSIRTEDATFGIRCASVLVGQISLGLAAWGFWRLACARFRRETEHRQG